MNDETFGQRIKRLREAKRSRMRDMLWSGNGFARQMGVSPPLLWLWEHDRKIVPHYRIARMAELLGCSEHYLRHGEEHPADARLYELRSKVRAFLNASAGERSRMLGDLQIAVRT